MIHGSEPALYRAGLDLRNHHSSETGESQGITGNSTQTKSSDDKAKREPEPFRSCQLLIS